MTSCPRTGLICTTCDTPCLTFIGKPPPIPYQFLESREADFEKMTWTFGLDSNSEVGAGRYAIVLEDHFEKMTNKLDHATRLLRHLRENVSEPHDQEKIDSFFDPEPLA
jgi:hypothetical protein